jgi:flavin-dependent dehydrogenase
MSSDTASAEVVVIGGGPAGAATAMALTRAGVSTLVVERTDGAGNPIGESLAPSATPLLHHLGLFGTFLATKPLPCSANRSSWGADGAMTEHHFLNEPYGHGWHLDRPAFNRALLAAAAQAGAVCWLRTSYVRAERTAAGRWLILTHGPSGSHEITANLVIDASGRHAVFARQQGARGIYFDRLTAIVTMLSPTGEMMLDSTTLIEATSDGWWYSALLPAGRVAVAFFSDPDILAAKRAWLASGWATLLEDGEYTRHRVSTHGYTLNAPLRFTPAGDVLLQPLSGERWVAVGDAATAHDPLSSHGIGSAIAAGQRAATAAVAYLRGNRDALREYSERTWRAYGHYLWLRQAYYAEVCRWPSAPFWQRRQTNTPLTVQHSTAVTSPSLTFGKLHLG